MIPTPLSSLNGLTRNILKTDLDLIKWFWCTTFLIMVLHPVFENSFLHEETMIMTIISEIMIQISHFQNLRKNFLKEALGIVELYCGIHCKKSNSSLE
jgi:hypothetical protein